MIIKRRTNAAQLRAELDQFETQFGVPSERLVEFHRRRGIAGGTGVRPVDAGLRGVLAAQRRSAACVNPRHRGIDTLDEYAYWVDQTIHERGGGDGAVAVDDLVDATRWDAGALGQAVLAQLLGPGTPP